MFHSRSILILIDFPTSRLSIQPETFSRILSRLSNAGLIQVERQSITLLDIDRLRSLLESSN